jgi:predicted ArsR family transcriptional regulator
VTTATGGSDAGGKRWTFLTNHGHMLLAVASSPDARVQDLAATVGVSNRAALTILQDLEDAGYLHRDRRGRRNHYTVEPGRPFRHPASAGHTVGELIALFADLTDATGDTT